MGRAAEAGGVQNTLGLFGDFGDSRAAELAPFNALAGGGGSERMVAETQSSGRLSEDIGPACTVGAILPGNAVNTNVRLAGGRIAMLKIMCPKYRRDARRRLPPKQ